MVGLSPGLIAVLLLILASEFVNGWTDAPNAIATVVSTRVMSPRAAVVLAVVFNLLGVLLMGTAVANTIGNIIFLPPGIHSLAIIGAAQLGIVVWSVAAWRFGIPTSESHALIAGLTGAGLAASVHPAGLPPSRSSGILGMESVNWAAWVKVLEGLVVSSVLGFLLGYLLAWIVVFVFRRAHRRRANKFFSYAQAVSAAAMAFSHGTQDGQKFMGVFARALVVAGLMQCGPDGTLDIPIWVMVLCSLVMAAGTSVGGYRIIKTMAMDMVKLEKYQGFAAELSASAALLAAAAFGIPVSTTHTKTTAIMGVGLQRGRRHLNLGIAGEMFVAWVLTFPVCAAIGFVMTRLFLAIL